jgi:AraC-like DNA-binding protein
LFDEEEIMPQYDRHKNRIVDIEFIAAEDFNSLPYSDRFTLIFITSGTIKGILNERPFKISAPAVLCLSNSDKIEAIEKEEAFAQAFCFHPRFFETLRLTDAQDLISANLRIKTGMLLFQRDSIHTGVPYITAKSYPQLLEWFFVLGTEVSAQSDILWVCRIKRYLIQILELLENLNRQSEESPVDAVLEYIHTNYPNKITLEDLTNCAHINRVSLNKMFQEICSCTAMGYLLMHRLKVAGNLLTHTNMSLDEIARSTGFEYDTYFIKQFTAKRGISPTTFRNNSRKHAATV